MKVIKINKYNREYYFKTTHLPLQLQYEAVVIWDTEKKQYDKNFDPNWLDGIDFNKIPEKKPSEIRQIVNLHPNRHEIANIDEQIRQLKERRNHLIDHF